MLDVFETLSSEDCFASKESAPFQENQCEAEIYDSLDDGLAPHIRHQLRLRNCLQSNVAHQQLTANGTNARDSSFIFTCTLSRFMRASSACTMNITKKVGNSVVNIIGPL